MSLTYKELVQKIQEMPDSLQECQVVVFLHGYVEINELNLLKEDYEDGDTMPYLSK